MSKKLKATVIRSFQPPFIEAVVPISAIPAYRIVNAIPPNGVIHRDDQIRDLTISVDTWPDLATPDTEITVMLTVDTDVVPEEDFPDTFYIKKDTWTALERQNGFTLTLEQRLLTKGSHSIVLYVISRIGNMSGTEKVPFVIITEASGGTPMAPLNFADEYLEKNGGITKEKFKNGMLPATVTSYTDIRVGDRITLLLGTDKDNMVPVADSDVIITADQNLLQEITVNFPEIEFDGGVDGPRFFSYRVTNQADFTSDPAREIMLQLALGERPTLLGLPVLRNVTNNLITAARLHTLHIDIPPYTTPLLGDVITLFFRGATGKGIFVNSYTLAQGDLGQNPIFSFSPGYLSVEPFDHGPLNIFYVVGRGASSIKSATSGDTVAAVNLDIPGGPSPDPTSTENGNLRPLIITGVNDKDNEITGPSVKLDANITIPILAVTQTTPGQTYLLAGDKITVVWGTKQLAPFLVGNNLTSDIKLVLPAGDIAESGGGFIPAHYIVSRTLAGQADASISVSPSQTIRVNSTNTDPGGDNGLKKPYWSNRNKYNAINVQTIKDYKGCNFTVDSYENIKVGQTITLRFHGTDGFDDTNIIVKDGTIFPTAATLLSAQLVITDENILLEKHNFSVPAAPFYTLCQGIVHVTYTVQQPGNGPIFTSLEAQEISDMKSPTSTGCTLPPA
ncbi:hypothetical protein [Yersinia intermedia]|uniref:hypothetical protein n=1 Tax=Yersinia intermedia TaxID=631 RepID=UPI001F534CD6|nr:hypothetical protein [Yersinia intermedia]UNK24779.1 hypothetical protein MNQ97_07340 [Yersinia intermedia]